MTPHFRRNPFLLKSYQQYLQDQNESSFTSKVLELYTQGSLERLVEHDSPQVRRAAVLALGLVGDYAANHALGRALQDEDRTVRRLSEVGIRNLWVRAGNDEERQQLATIVRLNSAKHYEDAVRQSTELLRKAAGFGEAWNQRGCLLWVRTICRIDPRLPSGVGDQPLPFWGRGRYGTGLSATGQPCLCPGVFPPRASVES